jgi:outer membrane protein TolC
MTARLSHSLRSVALAVGLLAFAIGIGRAQDAAKLKAEAKKEPVKKDREKPGPAVVSDTTLSLQDCIAIAMEKQPNIRAAYASLRATEIGTRSLTKLGPLAKILSPDLPYRKMQAERGGTIGQADVLKVQQEAVYDVTRLYYTFIYARQQENTATEIIEQMEVFYDIAKELVEQGAQPNLNQFSLFRMEDAIAEVKSPRVTARTGQRKALAALKEAMGVEQSFSFVPRDLEMPLMGGEVTEEQVVSFALSRRPEMVLASAGVDAFRLEVCAQNAIPRRQKVPTLAFASDLHSRSVPSAHRNGEYRPGALSPEMPPNLVGSREDRVARAREYSNRQESVLEKTRNLVELEATNSYLDWLASVERLKIAKARFESSLKMIDLSRKSAPNIRDYGQLIINEGLAAKAQADFLEAVYENIKALATLDRVTAGGVKPDFPQK